jgi:ABC-type multidrug transport system ATPase subunit
MAAIRIENLVRGYGRIEVLKGLSMTVDDGSIYGLLGPSGCGKTTLLKVILGFLAPGAGNVDVKGTIPGSDVGYAPQEIALYGDLSIAETLRFHGRLHGMTSDQIQQRESWLIEFLDLPPASKQIGKMSGGEKRRVSLAVALLHEPGLLLLDEPTVGVDPELRARIWDHLETISQQGTTVIITTHYIDEARQANRVGLMRDGVLLAEDSPLAVMESQSAESLEDAFLALCKREVKA